VAERIDPITQLVRELSGLPGVGEKTATRFAFHILRAPEEYAQRLAAAILEIKERIGYCERCCNLTETSPCRVCANPKREQEVICVVESAQDVIAIEATGEFRGTYHVLHGVIAPLDGVGPDDIKLAELVSRIGADEVREVIVATNPSVEGEATALYIKRLLTPLGVTVSRIASGLPMGSNLEYADKVTLGRSIADRRVL